MLKTFLKLAFPRATFVLKTARWVLDRLPKRTPLPALTLKTPPPLPTRPALSSALGATAWFLGTLTLAVTTLPYIRTSAKWIRWLDFPRLQFLTIGTIGALLSAALVPTQSLWFLLPLAASLGAAAVQVTHILKFTPLNNREVHSATRHDDQRRLRMLIVNVRMSNRAAGRFRDLIRRYDPDVVLINEPDQWWANQIRPVLVDYPYRVLQPMENTYGMILISKFPLHDAKVDYVIQDDVPSVMCQIELPSGDKIEFYGVHPLPPDLRNDSDKRDAELIVYAKRARASGRPTIVAGDLNDVAWSETTTLFKKISGLLDPRVGRGFFNTYNVFTPGFRYPLDHVFIDKAFRLVDMSRLPAFGSDHYPVLIELSYEPERDGDHTEHQPDADDKAHAQEILEKPLED